LEIRGKLIKKGGKYLTLPGKISISVSLNQIQVFIFSTIESTGGFPMKGGKITSLVENSVDQLNAAVYMVLVDSESPIHRESKVKTWIGPFSIYRGDRMKSHNH
jgi:hypothetical protein